MARRPRIRRRQPPGRSCAWPSPPGSARRCWSVPASGPSCWWRWG